MKTYTLYVHPGSSNATKTTCLADYMGLDYDAVVVGLERGEQRAPEFLSLNPMGRVPVLKHGDFVLWESGAIGMYLARSSKRQDLLGGDDFEAQADVERWLFWQANHLSVTCTTINFTRNIAPMLGMGDGSDTPAVERALGEFEQMASIVDARLGESPFLCGESITIADIFVGVLFQMAPVMRVDTSAYEHLVGWIARLEKDGALRPVGQKP